MPPVNLNSEDRVFRFRMAVDELRSAPNLSVRGWAKHGCEHFHPDVGEYWRPPHIVVEGDMNDMATLRVLSRILTEHGLKVHVTGPVSHSGDDYARLVLDGGA